MIRFSMAALYPSAHGMPGLLEVGGDERLRFIWSELNGLTRLGLVGGAAVFVLSPVFTIGMPLPAFWLSAERLDQHAHAATKSRIYLLRMAVFVVKMFGGLVWGQSPQARASMGLEAYPDDPGAWRSA